MHNLGSMMLEEILNSDQGGFRGQSVAGEAGQVFEFKEYRDKQLTTVLGSVRITRAYYYDKETKKGFCPKDKDLGIKGSSFSPGMRRIMGKVGAYRPFGLGHEDIEELAGISVTAKEIERTCYHVGSKVEEFYQGAQSPPLEKIIPLPTAKLYIEIDGTGVPVVRSETRNRQGKQGDGPAKTREAKLGCVFTQTTVDAQGCPIRDEASTSYVGCIETAEEFGDRIYAEAQSRGLDRAKEVCVIGDGAAWIWNIADVHFYGATQIIDIYHAREHYWTVAKAVLYDPRERALWAEQRRRELDEGEVEKLIAAINRLSAATEDQQESIEKESGYFVRNKERMRYKTFRNQGFFIGSGVVEAGCRTVIGQRLKHSGMHWSVRGANNIIALRCCIASNRWEDFWEYQAGA